MAKTIFCIWNIQLAEKYGCVCFVIIKIYVHKLFYLILILNLDWYAARLNSVQIMVKSMEVDLHGSQSGKWDGVRINFYLTEEDLKVFYNLKDIPMKALKVESITGWFDWIQS